jgi:excisionase family DNA binding protein
MSKNATDDLPELLTVAEFMAVFRVSRSTAVRWIEAGDVEALRPGTHYRIPRSEVERLLKRINAGGGSEPANEPAA